MASSTSSGASQDTGTVHVARNDNTELKEGIAHFYDQSSPLWEDMWGEHMHHGFYPPGVKVDHRKAQVDMIEKTLAWAEISDDAEAKPRKIVDVGCGIGGSARHLARKYGPEATVKAITLSPVQAARGNAICQEQGLATQVTLQVADALNQPFPDGNFDLVWSMESGEHMPDKPIFVGELARVAAPGGRIIVVTWCHRNLEAGETELKPDELAFLDQVCKAYYLPAWCSGDDYVKMMNKAGLENVRAADWTEYVTPFWPAVVASAMSIKGVIGLIRTGWTTIKGALAMFLMVRGYRRGLIKFVIVTAQKPLQ
eukprot:TRINITY_DN2763_c0_g1_i1.p1 TRINITY_DN2763_c0_g1~~TRINITY_DN2763_c0_g1_i1.p1  ORF type:complete len:312 (+),score=46.76 TRINITY_DN2763_c0_g1_i1:53-988(+)